MKKDRPLMVACPTCSRKVAYDRNNPYRPFCSERCKTTDLGAWASDAYLIEGGPGEDEPQDTPQTSPHRQD